MKNETISEKVFTPSPDHKTQETEKNELLLSQLFQTKLVAKIKSIVIRIAFEKS